MYDLLFKFVDPDATELDPYREDEFEKEIAKQREDEEWFVSLKDIYDLVTVGKINPKRLGQAFSSTVQIKFKRMHRYCRHFANFVIGLFYVGTIFAYAYAEYYSDNRSKQGIILGFTVVICDIYVWLIHKSGLFESSFALSIFSAVSRFLLYTAGKIMWVYGFMTIYILLGVFLTYKISVYHLSYKAKYTKNNIF
jgi:hypothetical protein